MKSVENVLSKKTKTAIGLMSGTSVDGVDAVLVDIQGFGTETQIKERAFITIPYESAIRKRLLDIAGGFYGGSAEICRMNFLLGKIFADACEKVIKAANFSFNEIDFIGSHGHTVYHSPQAFDYFGIPLTSTFQIGEPSVISERIGCPVVSDFRVRDIAAGGQGAPLVPYTEFLLYKDAHRNIALQNIGGIGNITLIPAKSNLEEVLAFDTGPGNMVIDALVFYFTQGKQRFDEDGAIGKKGCVNNSLLSWFLENPYYYQKPPKTTGREMYGGDYIEQVVLKGKELNLSMQDIIRTATAFTAKTIAIAIQKFSTSQIDRLIVGGGGSRNPVIMQELQERLQDIEVITNEAIGRNSESKEAVAFVVLANERLHGIPNIAVGATGAKHPVIMGKVSV